MSATGEAIGSHEQVASPSVDAAKLSDAHGSLSCESTPAAPSTLWSDAPFVITPRVLTYFAIFIVGLALRWIELDTRPVHHDESLHYMYGRYFFDFPEQNFTRYDPMLHGPMLYNLLRLVYNTLGSSTWSGRAFICVLGSLFMFVPFLFRRYFHRDALLALTAAIALSPTLIYWSRFLREDYLMIWSTVLVFYGALAAPEKYRSFLIVIGIALQWCIKANIFVHAAIFAGFVFFELFFVGIVHGLLKEDWKSLKETIAYRMLRHLDKFPFQFYLGLGLAIFIYCYFYTSGFRYSEGIIDGLWRKSILYWMNQHNIERIPGPFMFHFYQLSWYELPFVLVFLFSLVHPYLRASVGIQCVAGAALLLALGCYGMAWGTEVEKQFPWTLLKLKGPLDVFGACIIIFHSVLLTVHHMLRGERALAFFGYFFTAMFFTYSYLGEKVPWLATYPFIPGLVYLTLYFQHHFRAMPLPQRESFPWWRVIVSCGSALLVVALIFMSEGEAPNRVVTKLAFPGMFDAMVPVPDFVQRGFEFLVKNEFLVLAVFLLAVGGLMRMRGNSASVHLPRLALVVFCLYSIRAAILTNFTYAGHASEFISQVHTTHQLHDYIREVRHQIETPTRGPKPLVYVTGDATWPITWYMVDIPEYKFNASEEELKNFQFRFQDYNPDQSKQIEGFHRIDLTLRGWWVPDYNQMTLRRYLHYAINHRPWSNTGYSYVSVYVKK